jgi:transposase
MRAISMEVRKLATTYYESTKNVNATCHIFQLSRSTLWRLRQQLKTEGNLNNRPKTQPSKFSAEEKEYIAWLASHKRKWPTVHKIQMSFERKFHKVISQRTVRRVLRSASYRYKKCYARTKTSTRKKSFHSAVRQVPTYRLLAIDEMGFGHDFIHPRRSWFKKGQRPLHTMKRTKFTSKRNTIQ